MSVINHLYATSIEYTVTIKAQQRQGAVVRTLGVKTCHLRNRVPKPCRLKVTKKK